MLHLNPRQSLQEYLRMSLKHFKFSVFKAQNENRLFAY